MNSLPPRAQAEAIWILAKSRPIPAIILVFIVVVLTVVAGKHDPVVIKYHAHLGDNVRQIETFVIFNPNSEKLEITANLSPSGELNDLGFDEAYAIDMFAKTFRFAKLNVLNGGLSLFTVVRNNSDQNAIGIPGAVIEAPSSAMRSMTFAYLVNLIQSLNVYLQVFVAIFGLLVLYDPLISLKSLLARAAAHHRSLSVAGGTRRDRPRKRARRAPQAPSAEPR